MYMLYPTFQSQSSSTIATLATILATWSMLTTTKVWTLNIFVWLLLYPSVTRKALQTFDCIELLSEFYLRADPAVHCSGDVWWLMAVLASVGVFVTCILAPIALVTQMALILSSSSALTATLTPIPRFSLFYPTRVAPIPTPTPSLSPPGAPDVAQARLARADAALARRAAHEHLQGPGYD